MTPRNGVIYTSLEFKTCETSLGLETTQILALELEELYFQSESSSINVSMAWALDRRLTFCTIQCTIQQWRWETAGRGSWSIFQSIIHKRQ